MASPHITPVLDPCFSGTSLQPPCTRPDHSIVLLHPASWGTSMSQTSSVEIFRQDIYETRQIRISEVMAKLPQESVISLAAEVLRRVAAQKEIAGIDQTYATSQEIDNLCHALISEDKDEAANLIKTVRSEGASPETVYLCYLANAARMLGQWWDEDRISFLETALGTNRLYSIMRAMEHLFEANVPCLNRSAVFATVPGESHLLGIRMAADLFRKDGWDISILTGLDHDDLVTKVVASGQRVLGLSCSGSHSYAALARLVIALRVQRPGIRILLSGGILQDAREDTQLLDVDRFAEDVEAAKQAMTELWDVRANA